MDLDKLEHYDNVRQDLRDELKMRITQRDNFAVQYFVSIAAIILATMSEFGTYYVLLLLPIVSIYFTTQILYSYYIHDMICYFLREKVEKKITAIMDEDISYEWENFTHNNRMISNVKVPGIRRNFFVWSMWVTTLLSETVLFVYFNVENKHLLFNNIILSVTTILFLLFNLNVTYKFIYKTKSRRFE